jgi:hypothetical protein
MDPTGFLMGFSCDPGSSYAFALASSPRSFSCNATSATRPAESGEKGEIISMKISKFHSDFDGI